LIAEAEGASVVVKEMARQLLDTMRENERLREAMSAYFDTIKCHEGIDYLDDYYVIGMTDDQRKLLSDISNKL
jgi:hypothetical protein